MGEGNAMIAQVSNFYYDIFKDYVTDDYRDYLELVTKEYADLILVLKRYWYLMKK